MNELKESISYEFVAKLNTLSITEVIKIFDDNVTDTREEISEAICIDEFSNVKNSDNKYACIIINFKSHNIVDIIKNRTLPYLNEYFSKQPIYLKNRKRTKFVFSPFPHTRPPANLYLPKTHKHTNPFSNSKIE